MKKKNSLKRIDELEKLVEQKDELINTFLN